MEIRPIPLNVLLDEGDVHNIVADFQRASDCRWGGTILWMAGRSNADHSEVRRGVACCQQSCWALIRSMTYSIPRSNAL
jgi:hypothetical protein